MSCIHAGKATLWLVTLAACLVQTALAEGGEDSGVGAGQPASSHDARDFIGPDLIMKNLQLMESYGTAYDASAQWWRAAFSVAMTICNVGDEPAVFHTNTNQHPVWAQNMYRLHNHRFEQIGQSWLLHGWFATQQTACGPCENPFPEGNDGYLLGAGCSHPESTSLAGQQTYLGPRSEVNGFTGSFPYPFTGRGQNPTNMLQRRLLVDDEDVDPDLFPGAKYFVEVQVVSPDDAVAGNGNNNLAYRPAQRSTPVPGGICRFLDPNNPDARCFAITSFTRQNPAIHAWKESDASVRVTEIHVPETPEPGPMGLMLLGAKAVELGGGRWRYEYAIQNVNSHRSGASFHVRVPGGAAVGNAGFHDVFYHTGEEQLYDQTDWTIQPAFDDVTWSCDSFEKNPDANALRWSTMYNFWFEADAAPVPANVIVGFFRPVDGLPRHLTVPSIGPTLGVGDFNGDDTQDMFEFAAIQRCFSGDHALPGFAPPFEECVWKLDYDLDGDVDGIDFDRWWTDFIGPPANHGSP